MDDFHGKVAVVTGAASGIGLATTERFLSEGMKVVLADVEEGSLERETARLEAAGGEVCGVQGRIDMEADNVLLFRCQLLMWHCFDPCWQPSMLVAHLSDVVPEPLLACSSCCVLFSCAWVPRRPPAADRCHTRSKSSLIVLITSRPGTGPCAPALLAPVALEDDDDDAFWGSVWLPAECTLALPL